MVEAETPKTCHRCNGIGTINVGSGFSYIDMVCPECDGTGAR
jgi:DnaJ-class molecular chaperone